jgi:hypothetical protein
MIIFAVQCDYWQFKCGGDGICIDKRRTCDGFQDCRDGSDENELYCNSSITQEPKNEVTTQEPEIGTATALIRDEILVLVI